MKEGFRQCMAWLHTWTGLVVGWVLFFVFVTGTAGYFDDEITRWMQPERPFQQAQSFPDKAPLIEHAFNRLEQVAPVAASWSITLPHRSLAPRGWQDFSIRWEGMPEPGHDRGIGGSERLDPVSGATLPPDAEPRATAGGGGLYQMHYALHYMPYDVAYRVVGVCTMLMLLAIVTGVITHKKIFKDFFTFRPGKGQRSWLDAHNLVSVMALPFFLMITYSGLVFFMYQYMPAGMAALYGTDRQGREAYFEALFGEHEHDAIGRPQISVAALVAQAEAEWGAGQVRSVTVERHVGEPPEIVIGKVYGGSVNIWNAPTLRFHAETGAPLPPEPPAGGATRQTQSVLLALHEGLFATTWGRWLYFASGLLGCAMIGTGLVLWTVKRRKQHLDAPQPPLWEDFGVRLVETLNVATLAGLPLAVATFFWANRLLPVAITDRADWELHTLFAVWLGSLFYAMARPLHRAWIELLWAACAAYALVPLINALTTDKHLGNTLVRGDWALAGVDLTLWGLAAICAVMAIKVGRRFSSARAKVSESPVAGTVAIEQGAA